MPHKYHRNYWFLYAAVCFATALPAAQASRVTLAWDRSSDAAVAGYNLFYGTASGNYTNLTDAGKATTTTLSGLTESTTYYLVVTTYNAAGLQSLPSRELSFTTPANIPPTVYLITPHAGTSFGSAPSVSLSADANDADGTVTKVEFYAGSSQIGSATTAPFNATWNNAASGDYVLTALAYDDSGAAVRSPGVSVSVAAPGTQPSPTPTPGPDTKVRVLAQSHNVHAGAPAMFRIAANKINFSQPLVVNYSLGGTAVPGVDYTQPTPTGQVIIEPGTRAVTLMLPSLAPVTTTTTSTVVERKTVTVSVLPGTDYRAASQAATVVIRP